jgi:peptidoglycan/LPS O-acetylase OafA/YrhL
MYQGSRGWTLPYMIGWSGVDLFFVLSGFLISGLLFGEYKRLGSIDLKLFWIRRAFKIYPAFYALALYVIVVHACIGELTRHIFSDLFFLQDYITALAPHGWSLGVEEKFYFALPVLLLLMMRTRKKVPFGLIPYIFVAIFLGCLVMRVHSLLHFTSWDAIDHPAHLRMDSLFAGVTLGYFKYFRREEFDAAGRWPLWIPGVLLLVPLGFWGLQTPWMDTLGLGMISIGYALIVLWAVNRSLPEWRMLEGMAWIGRFSYSIYLWHYPLRKFLAYDETHKLILLPVYVVACLGVGWLAAYLIETPFLQLRDKFCPARSAALALGAGPSLSARPESSPRTALASELVV